MCVCDVADKRMADSWRAVRRLSRDRKHVIITYYHQSTYRLPLPTPDHCFGEHECAAAIKFSSHHRQQLLTRALLARRITRPPSALLTSACLTLWPSAHSQTSIRHLTHGASHNVSPLPLDQALCPPIASSRTSLKLITSISQAILATAAPIKTPTD